MNAPARQKFCRGCNEWRPLDEFGWRGDRGAIKTRCKACEVARQLEWRENNRERYNKNARNSDMRRKGIICEDVELWYDKQLEQQNGKCAMPDCRLPAALNTHGRLFIDHDHRTGMLRGLLCNRCNSFIGHYEKRKKLVDDYLNNLPAE
jgi:hypothetical protein